MGGKSSKIESLDWSAVSVQVHAVKLLVPHARIRSLFDANNPDFASSNLSLWSRDKPECVPATVALGNKASLAVHLGYNIEGLDGAARDITWTLRGRAANSTRFSVMGKPASITVIKKSLVARATLEFSGSSDVPWGLRDEIVWSVDVGYGDLTLHTLEDFSRTPMELYGICKDLVAWYERPGVPLDMLRLFVLPASHVSSIGSMDDWVTWVVQRCHASRADDDSKVPKEERVHAFRYDVVSSRA